MEIETAQAIAQKMDWKQLIVFILAVLIPLVFIILKLANYLKKEFKFVNEEIKNLRDEMRAEFKNVRDEMRVEFKNVREEMKNEFKNVNEKLDTVRDRISRVEGQEDFSRSAILELWKRKKEE